MLILSIIIYKSESSDNGFKIKVANQKSKKCTHTHIYTHPHTERGLDKFTLRWQKKSPKQNGFTEKYRMSNKKKDKDRNRFSQHFLTVFLDFSSHSLVTCTHFQKEICRWTIQCLPTQARLGATRSLGEAAGSL